MEKNYIMNENIGNRLKEIRIKKDLTKVAASEKIGISVPYLGDLEKGRKIMGINILCAICDAYRVTPEYILYGERKDATARIAEKKLNALTEEQKENLNKIVNIYVDSMVN